MYIKKIVQQEHGVILREGLIGFLKSAALNTERTFRSDTWVWVTV